MIILPEEDAELHARVSELNLIRQYDLLANCVEIGLKKGPITFSKHMLWALNHVAIANISHLGGRYREEPVVVGNHLPPPYWQVPELMDRFTAFLYENWYKANAAHLAAFTLWKLCWIHPFVEGNGRTARAACYFVICVKSGKLLEGSKSIPELIREDRDPYYAALRQADAAWNQGSINVTALAEYLASKVEVQLNSGKGS